MAYTRRNPDSLVNMLRQWLARQLDIYPYPGTFWCVGCSLRDGRTLIQRASRIEEIEEHMLLHPSDDKVLIRSAVTPVKETQE